ncbi:MAG TPA: galactose-1-phosphate uridylyltransferase [Candidatus Sumerlaeota bacterium]|nr:MAG: Galactose-1-phosphate uridylyltransferase [candidate division BRC1 bacterium ADurb.BinA292]HOE97413.1 galactose-1-phosphate uridylyltransferase [Candidatus Sumerlaeota bacterium]HOR27731.1 galactose-1-phosphate uridylyltransferase [Candidatus Sumerlaeota bacterium]HPK01016.1 galactose-1-phosphate uridylyltransferase [Candidatus Sumerlaeota bacterium]
MPEFRKDPVTGRWVIIATERAKRPAAFPVKRQPTHSNEECPFCPRREHMTPPEVLAYRQPGTDHNEAGWWLRVVPNKFPALVSGEPVKRSGDGMYDRINGMGMHEVVIETPRHDEHVGDMEVKMVEEIIWAYRDRTVEMRKDPRLEYVMIFKNHLREAGASIDHPHSQIIATPIVPKRVQEEIDGAQRYFDYKERCVFCDMIDQEKKDQMRLVAENELFIAFLPYASRFPFECSIMPKEHTSFFHDIQKNEVTEFAKVLKETMSRLKNVLDDPAFNWILHTTPLRETENGYYHWHMEIIPKLSQPAGFEWGTGFYINPFPPEDAARILKLDGAAEQAAG